MNLQEKSYQELKEITNYIQNWDTISKQSNVINISLLSGLTSIILVLIDTNVAFPELISKEKIKELVEKLIEILYKFENLLPSYCSGLAGVGFFLLKLKENDCFYEDFYDEILDEIDAVLDDMYKVEIEEDNFDMLHGALGIGLYFIERKKENKVIDIINRFDEIAIKKGNQIYWKTFDKYVEKKYFYDFGLAHGNAAILYFYLKCVKNNICVEESKYFINGIVCFYIENIQTFDDIVYSHFPYKVSAEDFDSLKSKPVNSRLAWCYGDLGIFHTLLLTAKLLNNVDLEKFVMTKLILVAKRTSKEEITLHDMDAGLCHGTSGVAFLLKNIYDITDETKLLPAIEYWTQTTFEMKDIDSFEGFNILGYSFPVFENTTQNVTLLEGLAGVAVSNLKYLTKKLSFTEEALFLTI